jgi:hypothetical protein
MDWSRRDFVRAVGAAAPIIGVGRGKRRRGTAKAPIDLAPGTELGPCALVRVEPVSRGRIPVVLSDGEGREATVHVYAHEAGRPGVARAGALGVYVANGGDGDVATNEAHGLGAMALAQLLEARQADGWVPPKLATLTEHSERFGRA